MKQISSSLKKIRLRQIQAFTKGQVRLFSNEEGQKKSKLYSPEFNREEFQKKFDFLKPPANEHFDSKMKIYGLADGQFLINHYWINGSVIVFHNRFYMWNVIDGSEIKPHTLEILNYVKPRPDYLIIGTGEKNLNLDYSFYEHFRRMGIVVDTCPSFEACSTFNLCNEDNYNVAAALLQPRISDEAGKSAQPKYDPDFNPPDAPKNKNMPFSYANFSTSNKKYKNYSTTNHAFNTTNNSLNEQGKKQSKKKKYRILRNLLKLLGLIGVGGTGVTLYNYPELKKEPVQILHAMQRALRCAGAGSGVLYDYLYCEEINSEVHLRAATRLYNCFRKNAGPYIKVGQMVGQMQLLLPPEYCDTFEPMCMQAPRTGFDDVKKIVEKELGKPLSEVFSSTNEYLNCIAFEEEPIASASLAQVHRATLKQTGEEVAVKVQHKWIKEQVPGDIALIQLAVDIALKIFPDFKYGWLPNEFRERLPKELDFTLEAQNAERCREIFKDNPSIVVPKIYHELTKERVMVMSFEKGTPITHIKDIYNQGIDLNALSRLIQSAFIKMIFVDGFVHADPHPGNLFVRRKEGSGDLQLVVLDHGIYTTLPDSTRHSYAKLWRGILSQNEQQIRESSKELGADFYELFTAIIVNRTFEDVMNSENALRTKSRLGMVKSTAEQQAIKQYALIYHREIVDILDTIKRELLLLLKTNNYLRAIDKRLGYPNNSFQMINDISWQVYSKEIRVNRWIYMREYFKYHWLQFLLFLYKIKIKILHLFGIKVTEEELQDFGDDFH